MVVRFSVKRIEPLGPNGGYNILLEEIVVFFKTEIVPIEPEEKLEILDFMEAVDESKKRGGIPVSIKEILQSNN